MSVFGLRPEMPFYKKLMYRMKSEPRFHSQGVENTFSTPWPPPFGAAVFTNVKKARGKVPEKGARLTEKSVYAMISMCFCKHLPVFRRHRKKRRHVFGG
jgi:hypothetical protein